MTDPTPTSTETAPTSISNTPNENIITNSEIPLTKNNRPSPAIIALFIIVIILFTFALLFWPKTPNSQSTLTPSPTLEIAANLDPNDLSPSQFPFIPHDTCNDTTDQAKVDDLALIIENEFTAIPLNQEWQEKYQEWQGSLQTCSSQSSFCYHDWSSGEGLELNDYLYSAIAYYTSADATRETDYISAQKVKDFLKSRFNVELDPTAAPTYEAEFDGFPYGYGGMRFATPSDTIDSIKQSADGHQIALLAHTINDPGVCSEYTNCTCGAANFYIILEKVTQGDESHWILTQEAARPTIPKSLIN